MSMRRAARLRRIEQLPAANTKRWVISRKAAVVRAVHHGTISLDEACRRYNISTEEFLNWQDLLEAHGTSGLRVLQAQKYRSLKAAH